MLFVFPYMFDEQINIHSSLKILFKIFFVSRKDIIVVKSFVQISL